MRTKVTNYEEVTEFLTAQLDVVDNGDGVEVVTKVFHLLVPLPAQIVLSQAARAGNRASAPHHGDFYLG